MKNKFIFFVFFLSLVFLTGIFSLRVQAATPDLDNANDCGANEQGYCLKGSCSDYTNYINLSGGRSCSSGYTCCVENVGTDSSKSLKGENCGAGNAGTCMDSSMLMCPTNYSAVSGGTSCSGVSLKCCAPDDVGTTCKKGETFDVNEGGCLKDADPSAKSGFSTSAGTGSASGGVQPLGKIDIPDGIGLPNNTVQGVVMNGLTWLLGLLGVLALIGFVVSGIQYLLAYTDPELAETAKKNFTYSILGVVAALSSFIIIQAVQAALTGTSSLF